MNKIVFTNGCFDIIHSGHVELLEKAKALGSRLIVGINSDESVRTIKGPGRPIKSQNERARILEGFGAVDEVRIFGELTPERLIREIAPDVLVKGGDWAESEIVGASIVKENGGSVVTIPLKEGLSSSSVIEGIKSEKARASVDAETNEDDSVGAAIKDHIGVFEHLLSNVGDIRQCGEIILDTLKNGGKILICGNGGSAADAQHLAAELVGRYETDRRALPAIALTTDSSSLTAISNDLSFDRVFERQVAAHAQSGDTLIGISTSGESPNVIKAIMAARDLDCKVVGLTSSKGRKMAALCDGCVMVPSERTSRVQEAHIAIAHSWCEMVDAEYT